MLNRRRTRFVHEYLVDLNGRQAAIRAGCDPKAARRVASDLLATDEVRAAVEKAMAARAARLGITPEQVLQRWWDIANADPAELIEHRRVCCRHCYGKDHRYQRTPSEMAKAIDAFNEAQMLAESKGERFACTLDPQGGIGYDARKDPNPDCPECFGEGVALVHAKDTRDLSPTAKRLYAGVTNQRTRLLIATTFEPVRSVSG